MKLLLKSIKFLYNEIMSKIKRLLDEYHFPGFYPKAAIKGKFGDSKAKVIQLVRRQKKRFADAAEHLIKVFMTVKSKLSGTYPAAMREFICRWKCTELIAKNV